MTRLCLVHHATPQDDLRAAYQKTAKRSLAGELSSDMDVYQRIQALKHLKELELKALSLGMTVEELRGEVLDDVLQAWEGAHVRWMLTAVLP